MIQFTLNKQRYDWRKWAYISVTILMNATFAYPMAIYQACTYRVPINCRILLPYACYIADGMYSVRIAHGILYAYGLE